MLLNFDATMMLGCEAGFIAVMTRRCHCHFITITGPSGYLARQNALRVCFSNNANGRSATHIGATGTNVNTTKTITVSRSPAGRYVAARVIKQPASVQRLPSL